MESVEIKEDNNKNDNKGHDEDEHQVRSTSVDPGAKKKKTLDLDAIGDTVVGLKTYEVTVTEEQILRYMDFTQSHKDPSVSIWAFLSGLVLIIINIIGKKMKNDQMEEY